eukprot:6197243-Prymnesium_polylepis.2
MRAPACAAPPPPAAQYLQNPSRGLRSVRGVFGRGVRTLDRRLGFDLYTVHEPSMIQNSHGRERCAAETCRRACGVWERGAGARADRRRQGCYQIDFMTLTCDVVSLADAVAHRSPHRTTPTVPYVQRGSWNELFRVFSYDFTALPSTCRRSPGCLGFTSSARCRNG